MAFESKLATFQVAASTGSPVVLDITSSGFGTAQGALIVLSGSTSDSSTPENHEILSVGLTDGTRHRCLSYFAENNAGTTDSTRTMRTGGGLVVVNDLAGGTSIDGELTFNSFITDGIRLNYTASEFTAAYRGYVVFFKGADNLEVNSFTNTGVTPHVLVGAFKPDLIYFHTTTAASDGVSNDAVASFGFAARGAADSISTAVLGRSNRNGRGAVEMHQIIEANTVAGSINTGASGWNRSIDLSAWNTDGFETTRTGATSGVEFHCLAIKLPSGQEALCGTDTSPTSATNKGVTTNYSAGTDDSEICWILQGTNTASDQRDANSNSMSYGMGDSAGNEAVTSLRDEDNAGTSESESAFLDSAIVLTHDDTGAVEEQADLTNMLDPDLDLNYSTADASARHFLWCAIQAGAGSFTLDADPGAVTIAGTAATLARGYKLTADPGAVTLAGTDATLARGLKIAADPGAITISGTDATLSYSGAGSFTLDADPGAVTIAGTDATLAKGYKLTADPGAIAIAGTAATLVYDRSLTADSGSVTLAGTAATLVKGHPLTADAGAITIEGTAATFDRTYVLGADPGAITIVGAAATLLYSAGAGLDTIKLVGPHDEMTIQVPSNLMSTQEANNKIAISR